MIPLMYELKTAQKVKDHIKRNWPLYAAGAGITAGGFAAEKVVDDLLDKGKTAEGLGLRGGRTVGMLAAGASLKKTHDKLNPEKRKRLQETSLFKDTESGEKTAKVVEKTGGKRAVGHLRKHWKKYAALTGLGVAASLGAEGMRIGAHQKIKDAAEKGDIEGVKKASRVLRKGEVADNSATALTVGAGSLAAAGKIFDRRKNRR